MTESDVITTSVISTLYNYYCIGD